MNQILSTGNNYNDYNRNDTRKIIRIFCILLIILALAIGALAIYNLQKNKKVYEELAKPQIQIERKDESHIVIMATCEDGISNVIYIWNFEEEQQINLNGSTSFERIIDIPYNQINTLELSVISSKNIKAEATEEIKRDGIDKEKPEIKALTVVGSKLNIEVADSSGVKYIEYQWEGEETNTVYFEEDNEDNKEVSTIIDIERGTHKLTIVSEDIFGNKEKISRLVTGVNEPEIQVIRYGKNINITAIHDMGIKEIAVLINNKLYVYDEESPEYSKEDTTVQVEYPLEEGENIVKIMVFSYEKLSPDGDDSIDNYSNKSFIGKCSYSTEGEE